MGRMGEGGRALGELVKKRWKEILKKILLGCLLLSLTSVLFYRFVPIIFTPLMLIRSVGALSRGQWVGVEQNWVPLDRISPHMTAALLKSEDAQFFQHSGFDLEAIERAYHYNKTHKRKKGASTISQQTAKNVFLWPSRTWVRKGLEAYFTVLIEALWSKERILEVYLNVVEFGPGVYGVEAAAQRYFKKKSQGLNAYQASLLAAVLPNPHRYRVDRPSEYIRRRQVRILRRHSPSVNARSWL
jgi:monofunctional biosynthetic peptidoglycan transglycosylase